MNNYSKNETPNINEKIAQNFAISPGVLKLIDEAENQIDPLCKALDDIAMFNQYKVLNALQKNRLSDTHFAWNTGYGYDDQGREITEKIYADVFATEAAIVRPLIVNGTHAISLALTGILRPNDHLLYATGAPYDTVQETVGLHSKGNGSLMDFGIEYSQVELKEDGSIDIDNVLKSIKSNTKVIGLQRATGYAWRNALTIKDIEEFCEVIKSKYPDIIIFADNCYGEFLDTKEPTEVGVDVIAGSLIKNPGGGIALSGGYIAGKKQCIEQISYRMTTPGIGGECGLTFGQTRTILQGLFLAPNVVKGALKGAMLCGQVFKNLGFEVNPDPTDNRSDIIQSVKLHSEEALISFCRGIQAASPVDSFVVPQPWDMPGYEDQVIMAAGAFVQGSSIELSADGPIREPFIVYFQGGLTYDYSKLGVIKALQSMFNDNLIKLD